jgi:CRP/FNR family transcriptional regulator, cyclic AMP receptor protein
MLFEALTADELAKVEAISVVREFGQGSLVIEEGKAGDSFFLLLSGRAETRKEIGTGRYKKLVEMGPCDAFGEIGFLGVEHRSASVVALTDCRLLEFDQQGFGTLLETDSVIGSKVYRGIARVLATRLARNDDDLRDAIRWAMHGVDGRPRDGEVDVPHRGALRLVDLARRRDNAPPKETLV